MDPFYCFCKATLDILSSFVPLKLLHRWGRSRGMDNKACEHVPPRAGRDPTLHHNPLTPGHKDRSISQAAVPLSKPLNLFQLGHKAGKGAVITVFELRPQQHLVILHPALILEVSLISR
ncbi:hypothetical protein J6590_066140 [Homalodisca vitripennis]|nr:hypothetical protein J6590_066140 [Homalodisca vitripennis]